VRRKSVNVILSSQNEILKYSSTTKNNKKNFGCFSMWLDRNSENSSVKAISKGIMIKRGM